MLSCGCIDAGSSEPASARTAESSAGLVTVREGFEETALEATPDGWSVTGYGDRRLAVTSAVAARGAQSLRIDVASGQGAVVAMLTRGSSGELALSHHGRIFVRIEGPGASQFVHFDVFEGTGAWNGRNNSVRWASTGTGAGSEPRNWSWIYNVQPSADGEFGTEGDRSAHPRVDEWMCLEWAFDARTQEARFWLDGLDIDYLQLLESAGARTEIPEFRTLSVGFQKFQPSDGFVVWIDEVAFDVERIGCD
jgi:hypothetical protein